ncbi:MAG TPA: hypothetical protein K8W09_14170 [Parabacteroides johnsonii]|uniref:hypothetical protein n=1 Tax=Parabacteroides johnsonii TaxID=387661 RepID=UPI001DE5B4C3|nr:hypothetical protein [Parabacteroides johnsonii]HJH00392.1 hypothetical protein [Parabacteroides johnsonii]
MDTLGDDYILIPQDFGMIHNRPDIVKDMYEKSLSLKRMTGFLLFNQGSNLD